MLSSIALAFSLVTGAGSGLKPVRHKDFPGPIPTGAFDKVDAALIPAAAAAKRKAALKSADRLSRAYPKVNWGDFRPLEWKLLPGKKDFVYGDLHPDQFAFVRVGLGGKTLYDFADFANSGHGHVAVDANRYFMNLRLQGLGNAAFRETLSHYVEGLGSGEEVRLPGPLKLPSWRKLEAHRLDRLIHEGSFEFAKKKLGLTPASPEIVEALTALTHPSGALEGYHLHGVGDFERVEGSTGGYARYWVHAEKNGRKVILELEQSMPPAVTALEGADGQLPEATRLHTLQQVLWRRQADQDYFPLQLTDKSFTARDRLRMSLPDLSKLKSGDLQKVLNAQAARIARTHAPGWRNVAKNDVGPLARGHE